MPEGSQQVVVVNATPIIALALISRLELLKHLYGRVIAPAAVYAEVLAGGPSGIGRAEIRAATWLHAVTLQDPRRADLLADLDRGEAEVIALAQELDAGLVILDERLARRHARRLGLRLTGTLGVILRAKQLGLVEAVGPLIDQMRQGGIWLSDTVVARVLELADEA